MPRLTACAVCRGSSPIEPRCSARMVVPSISCTTSTLPSCSVPCVTTGSLATSALVGRQGQMRLIVGADFDPDDVRAIPDGSEERLAVRFDAEIDGATAWPEGVRHGVELLA